MALNVDLVKVQKFYIGFFKKVFDQQIKVASDEGLCDGHVYIEVTPAALIQELFGKEIENNKTLMEEFFVKYENVNFENLNDKVFQLAKSYMQNKYKKLWLATTRYGRGF